MAITEEDEQAALVARIREFPGIAGTEVRLPLFEYLLKNRGKRLSAKIIEHEHFKVPINQASVDPKHTRAACSSLREGLEAYRAQYPDDPWQCDLPAVKKGSGGYQLTFTRMPRKVSAVERFWAPHLDVKDHVLVIGGTHLFFFDPTSNSVLRYYDFNEGGEDEELLAKLAAVHPASSKLQLEPLYNSYLSTGEVRAFEIFQRWFHSRTTLLLHRLTSREVPEIKFLKSSPILFGRPATNKYIRKIMRAPEASMLGYRVQSTMGAVSISKPTAQEKDALASFPFTKAGVLGPTKGWKTIFGVVTRLPHLSGYGHVTIISADSQANVYSQIIEVLTDERLLKEMLLKTQWPLDADLPETFEMLFSVTRSPGGLEGEGHAQLLACRSYTSAHAAGAPSSPQPDPVASRPSVRQRRH